MEAFLTKEPTSFAEMANIDLNNVIGKIEILDTQDGKAFQEILKSDIANYVKIKPYGFGEKDDDSNITNFQLMGFSIGL